MQLLAVFVGDDISSSGPRIRPKDNSILEDYGADGSTGLGHLWGLVAIVGEKSIPLAILKTESRLGSLHWH